MRSAYLPRWRGVALVGLGSLIAGAGAVLMAFRTQSLVLAVISVVAILFAAFLLLPVIRCQTIEVCDKCIVVHTFGRGVELTVDHLTEVFVRKNGIQSYRFQRGNLHYQVTPAGYHDSDMLQREFDRLFFDSKELPFVGK